MIQTANEAANADRLGIVLTGIFLFKHRAQFSQDSRFGILASIRLYIEPAVPGLRVVPNRERPYLKFRTAK